MATKKTATKKTAPKTAPKAEEKKQTKMEQAVAIFNKMKDSPRKDVVQAFMDEAGLTKAGSSTYYQLIKKKNA